MSNEKHSSSEEQITNEVQTPRESYQNYAINRDKTKQFHIEEQEESAMQTVRDVTAGALGFTVGVVVATGTFAGLSATSFWSDNKSTNASLFCNNTSSSTEVFDQPSNNDAVCAITGGMLTKAAIAGTAGLISAYGTYSLVQKTFDWMDASSNQDQVNQYTPVYINK